MRAPAATISARDARAALALAGDFAACRSAGDLARPLAALGALVGADAVAAGEIRRPGRTGAPPVAPFVTDRSVYDLEACAAVERRWREHPLLVRHLRGPSTEVRKVSDFVTPSRWRRLSVYRDGYRRMGLLHEMTVELAWASSGTVCVALHRAGGDFGERERGLLARLAPHARAVHERVAAAASARRLLGLLERGLQEHGGQPVLVDRDGAVLAAVPRAAELLAGWFAPGRGGRLPGELADWHARRRGEPRPAPLVRTAPGRRLEVRLVAGDDEDVLVVAERRDAPPDPDALRRALPVTRREADVLTHLAAGRTNAEIAFALGISAHTVARHVEAVYRKLGVGTRAAATAAALHAA